MLSDRLRKLADEIDKLTDTVQRENHRGLEAELNHLIFKMSQERNRKLAIHYNYLAVCHRCGITPYEFTENPYG